VEFFLSIDFLDQIKLPHQEVERRLCCCWRRDIRCWKCLIWHRFCTKFHKYRSKHSNNIKVLTWTIWKTTVLVLLQHGFSKCAVETASSGMAHIRIYVKIGKGFQKLLGGIRTQTRRKDIINPFSFLDIRNLAKAHTHTHTHTKTKLHGLSPRANYTDRATAACRRSDCQLVRIEDATWSAW
jgi:hypothetical protein